MTEYIEDNNVLGENSITTISKKNKSPAPKRIFTITTEPKAIVFRPRYDHERAKEYGVFLDTLAQYETDKDEFKSFLENEEYKKLNGGIDKPAGNKFVSFQAPVDIHKAFIAQTEENKCTQVSAFVSFMNQYGKGKQVKFADEIKNLKDDVKKLTKELEKKKKVLTVENTSLVVECSCDKTELERVRSELVEAKNNSNLDIKCCCDKSELEHAYSEINRLESDKINLQEANNIAQDGAKEDAAEKMKLAKDIQTLRFQIIQLGGTPEVK